MNKAHDSPERVIIIISSSSRTYNPFNSLGYSLPSPIERNSLDGISIGLTLKLEQHISHVIIKYFMLYPKPKINNFF